MSEDMKLLMYYFFVIGFATQLGLLFLQIRTFARTRHASLMILAVATGIGSIYLVLCSLANMVSVPDVYERPINYIGAVLLTINGVLGLWGAAWLFHAFQVAFAKHQPNNNGA